MTRVINARKVERLPQQHGGALRRGRPAGVPNKLPRILKEALLLVAEETGHPKKKQKTDKDGKVIEEFLVPGDGGLHGYLQWIAIQYPKQYTALLGKVIPLQVDMSEQMEEEETEYVTLEEVTEELNRRGIPVAPKFK